MKKNLLTQKVQSFFAKDTKIRKFIATFAKIFATLLVPKTEFKCLFYRYFVSERILSVEKRFFSVLETDYG